jgi:nucleotide-binding universal stress UspA family protein
MIAPALRHQIEYVVVEFCAPTTGVLEMANGVTPDLLILGASHRGSFLRASTHGLLSITDHTISGTPCPLLTIRAS